MYHLPHPPRGVAFLLFAIAVLAAPTLHARHSDSLIFYLKKLTTGERVWVTPVVEGEVFLYRYPYFALRRSRAKGHGKTMRRVLTHNYFIGNETLEAITLNNYKSLVRKHLGQAPYLAHQVGKKGFRFENLAYMVTYFNQTREQAIPDSDHPWEEVPLLQVR